MASLTEQLLFFFLLVAVAFVPLVKGVSDKEQVIGTLALALAEILAIILIGAVLVQYLQQYFRRSHRFMLGNIVNEAELTSSANVPSSWSNLLRERLGREVEHVQRALQSKLPPADGAQTENAELSPDQLRPYIEAAYPLEGELEKCLATLSRSLPTPSRPSMLTYHGPPENIVKQVSGLNVEFEVKERQEAVALLASSVPDQVAPIMAVLSAIFPTPVIRINGYLQCCGNPPSRVGLTYEFLDESTPKRSQPPDTIWMETGETGSSLSLLPQKLQHDRSSTPTQPPTTVSLCEQMFSAMSPVLISTGHAHEVGGDGLRPSTGAVTKLPSQQTLSLTQHYMQLLGPAVRWLALELLEQWLKDHAPTKVKRSPKPTARGRTPSVSSNGAAGEVVGEPDFLEVVTLLFGELYYASADDYPACHDFFWRKAAEHFQTAIEMKSYWWLPYRALGYIMVDKLRQMGYLTAKRSGMKDWRGVTTDELTQMRERLSSLLENTQHVHKATLDIIHRQTRADPKGEEKEIEARILVSQATALLHYGDKESLQKARQILREERRKNDFIDYEGKTTEDNAVLLNNVACWYGALVDEMDAGWVQGVPQGDAFRAAAVREARFYMTACLLRNTDRGQHLAAEEPDLRSICPLDDLQQLKDVVHRKLGQDSQLDKSKDTRQMRQAAEEVIRQVNWQSNPSIPDAQVDLSGLGNHRPSQASEERHHIARYTDVWLEETHQ